MRIILTEKPSPDRSSGSAERRRSEGNLYPKGTCARRNEGATTPELRSGRKFLPLVVLSGGSSLGETALLSLKIQNNRYKKAEYRQPAENFAIIKEILFLLLLRQRRF